MQRFVAVVMGAAVTVAGSAALLGGLTPPAGAQLGNPGWGEGVVDVDEAAGEVVLTLEFGGTGNVKYWTIDVSARAPEDYTAVSGEVIFTHPGSREIRIPIVDDTLAEGDRPGFYEVFEVHAVEEPNPDPWPYAGSTVTVEIIDDDTADTATAEAPATTSASRVDQDSHREDAGSPSTVEAPNSGDGATVTTQTPATTAVARETVRPKLRPGPGFELTSTAAAGLRHSHETDREADGSFRSMTFVSGTAAVAAGAFALGKRRRRWSPTRP